MTEFLGRTLDEAQVRVPSERWRFCIQSLYECADACVACADVAEEAMREPPVRALGNVVRLTRHCAEVCRMTASMLERSSSDNGVSRMQLEDCGTACEMCAAECELHASQLEQCHVCAEMCHLAATLCDELIEYFT